MIVSDNGSQFASKEFKEFLDSYGIRGITSAPYHPKTNGLAEREVRTFKSRMRALANIRDANSRLQKFLFSYRTTPQQTTGKTPAEILFGRPLRTKFDLIKPSLATNIHKAVVKQKLYHDKRKSSRNFKVGEEVWATIQGQKAKTSMEGTI